MKIARYKVPFRSCYTDSLVEWLRWTLWCHVVLRVFPYAQDVGAASP